MSDNVEKTPTARWEHLRDKGSKLLVDLTSNDTINDKPSWLDEEKFARAKKAIETYYLGISYSSLTGLLLILQLPDGLEPLLVTGNSKDIPSLYRRYLSTVLHVNSWYEDDIFDPETKGYKSIRQVRLMHKRVQQLMNEKFKVNDLNGQPRLWMTQYDVALTQFAFIGLAMLHPQKCALIAASHEDMELINYYWRVLGWCMGISDEFNACQFDKYEDIREFNRIILEEGYKERFKEQPCEKGLEMTKAICVAMHFFTPLITFNSLAYWWKDCFEFNGYKQQPLTGKEKILNLWTSVSFNHLLKHKGFLDFSTKLHKKRFLTRLKKKDEVYSGLKTQYQGCPHLAFFSDRENYFDTKNIVNGSTINNGNNNNNGTESDDEISRLKAANAVSSTTFHGCPLGYETILPALTSDANQQAAVA